MFWISYLSWPISKGKILGILLLDWWLSMAVLICGSEWMLKVSYGRNNFYYWFLLIVLGGRYVLRRGLFCLTQTMGRWWCFGRLQVCASWLPTIVVPMPDQRLVSPVGVWSWVFVHWLHQWEQSAAPHRREAAHLTQRGWLPQFWEPWPNCWQLGRPRFLIRLDSDL